MTAGSKPKTMTDFICHYCKLRGKSVVLAQTDGRQLFFDGEPLPRDFGMVAVPCVQCGKYTRWFHDKPKTALTKSKQL